MVLPSKQYKMKNMNPEARHEGSGYLPFDYLAGFLKFLHDNRDIIEIFTYADLHWPAGDYSPDSMYRKEFSIWKKDLKTDRVRRKKIHLLLQHDVDSVPEQSMKTCRLEYELDLPSNLMIFNRRIDRPLLKNEDQVRYTDYPLDDELLSQATQSDFVVGYHCNAFEQSHFDMESALDIFETDLDALRAMIRPNRLFLSPWRRTGSDGRE